MTDIDIEEGPVLVISPPKEQQVAASEVNRLSPNLVASFYRDLQELYERYDYSPFNIWNVDKSSVQAERNGGE